MLGIEMAAGAYLAISTLSAVALWLIQRRGSSSDDPSGVDTQVSMLGVMLVAGLAWPISIPLAIYGWLREAPGGRRTRWR
jgi:hypothetical protein